MPELASRTPAERDAKAASLTTELGKTCAYVKDRGTREEYKFEPDAAFEMAVHYRIDEDNYRPALKSCLILGYTYSGTTTQDAFDAMRPDAVALCQALATEAGIGPLTDHGAQPLPKLTADGADWIYDIAGPQPLGEPNRLRWTPTRDGWDVSFDSITRLDEPWPGRTKATAAEARAHMRGLCSTLATWIGEPFGLLDMTPLFGGGG